jgi:catechol 2,3-dioxygenase-like lactoylglutathione lyase family enzyme
MLRSVSTVTFAVDDFDGSCRVPEEAFGYLRVDGGHVDEACANSWDAPATAGRRYAVFAPPSETRTFLRLVEAPPTPGYEPLRTFGWNATEFLVTDVRALADKLRGGPLEIIGGPRDLLENGAAIALQVKGPSGEIYYLTEINGAAMQRTYGRAVAEVDRVFIVVLGARDRDDSRAFYRSLGLATPRPRQFSIRVLAAAHGLDPLTTKFPIGSAVLPEPFRIEIDGYPETATSRPCLDGHLPPGMSMVTFNCDPDCLDGRKRRLLRGPDGELIELIAASR